MLVNRICLLGFSKNSEDIIKSLIDDLPPPAPSITWVSANDKTLTGVVINASFLDTPQIQKYINYVNCPVTSAYSNDEGKQLATEHRDIPSLDLRNPAHDVMLEWLNYLVEQEKPMDLESGQYVKKPTEGVLQEAWSTSHLDLMELIKGRAETVIEAKYKEHTTWIEPHKGLVFINYPRESVPGIDKWQWRNTTADHIASTARRLKADLWFFETLWQSSLELGNQVDANTFYKMERWPQPLGKEGRSQALRLAAFAQKQPVNIDFLAEKTGYHINLIRKFIFATQHSGQLHEVSSNTHKTKDTIESSGNTKENQQKRSLLSRFRQKLGI